MVRGSSGGDRGLGSAGAGKVVRGGGRVQMFEHDGARPDLVPDVLQRVLDAQLAQFRDEQSPLCKRGPRVSASTNVNTF